MKQKIITLVCNKGGVGRSTTAQNIGWKLAEIGYKVLVADLDSQANTSIKPKVLSGLLSVSRLIKWLIRQ